MEALNALQGLDTPMDLDKSSSKQLATLTDFPTDEGGEELAKITGSDLAALDVSPIGVE